MTDLLRRAIASQFIAALDMFDDCLRKCPPEHWDTPVARYPFWHVAYHTLCYVDLYLTPGGEAAYTPRPEFHPRGWAEFEEEYPSRRFAPSEIAAYSDVCRRKIDDTLAAETGASLAGPSGYSRLSFSRAELHLYNLRHLQHHTGQLSALLRRVAAADPVWVRGRR